MYDVKDQIIRQHRQMKRRELIERAVMQRTPQERPISCSTADVEAWLASAMVGSRQVVAAVCGRLAVEDWTSERLRDLFVLFSAVATGDTKAEAVLSDHIEKLAIKPIGASPPDVVLACDRIRKARRQRLVLALSEQLFLDGDQPGWTDRAREAIAAIEAIPDVPPLKGGDK